jgi:hypothetical protein
VDILAQLNGDAGAILTLALLAYFVADAPEDDRGMVAIAAD